jgi:hypothetical protein
MFLLLFLLLKQVANGLGGIPDAVGGALPEHLGGVDVAFS